MPSAWTGELDALLEGELRDGAPDDPFRPAVLRWAASTGRPVDHDPLLELLERIVAGGRGANRFRWRLPVGSWIPLERRTRWRPAEAEQAERQPGEHAARLWTGPVIVEHLAWLETLAAGEDRTIAARARVIADEALPAIEDVVAATVGGIDPWADTFLLWSFVREPRALRPVRSLVLALAARYVARAARTGGPVHGRTFPFYDQAMPSATAHLATAAAALGEGIGWVDEQLAFLAAVRSPDGSWGDPHQPPDLLTTLAATRLFGSLDPSFDPVRTVAPLRRLAAECGPRPGPIGPEWPWVAKELRALAAWAELPFTRRFRWPNVPESAVDRRVRVPRLEGYLMVADLFRAVPALGRGRVDVAFLDLANFGKWNSEHGQAAGDDLLALLTRQLRTIDDSRTYRDGGDEFLLVGTPGTDGLADRLASLSRDWPEIQRAAFPSLPVVPIRAVVGREPAHALREARERQGVAIGSLKAAHPRPPDEGVIEQLAGPDGGAEVATARRVSLA